MNSEKVKLSIKQIKDIKHALGGEIKKDSYRNHYCTGNNESESWNELVDMGYATKQYREVLGGYFYSVTNKAIKDLEDLQ